MSNRVRARFHAGIAVLTAAVVTLGLVSAGLVPLTAAADTTPPAGEPKSVSIDPLPTVQINGVAWDEEIVGNTVFVVGKFTSARPAGSPLGTNEVARSNMLAYDLSTGELLTSFDHVLNGQAKVVTASPDGTRLYIGGNFTKVDGQQRVNLAAFDLPSGNLVSTWKTDISGGGVVALAATNSAVYVGGTFSKAKGVARTNLAAFDRSGTLLPWTATPTGTTPAVVALLVTPDQSKVVVSGRFTHLNGLLVYGLGAVDSSTGATVPWASQSSSFKIRNVGDKASLTSLSTDGTYIYATGYNFGGGNFEGTTALNPTTGAIVWLQDCHGDTYDAFPLNGIVYSVSHAHDCQPAGYFPETSPRSWRRALASTTNATRTNGPATQGYPSFQGLPAPTQVNWYPTLTVGNSTGSGSYQAAWSVAGSGKYLVLTGEFLTVEGVAQQGLVRYAMPDIAPNDRGPKDYTGYPVSATTADAGGSSTITWPTTFDRDNEALSYYLYRDGSSTPLTIQQATTRYWQKSTMSFVDTGLVPGSTHFYKISARDPFGNATIDYSLVNDTNAANIAYSSGWTYSANRNVGDYGNDVHWSSANGSSMSFTFKGSSVALVTEKHSSLGIVAVSVDGGAPTDVNLSLATGAARQVQQKVFSVAGLSSGNHTLTVTKVSGQYAMIDGLYAPGGVQF